MSKKKRDPELHGFPCRILNQRLLEERRPVYPSHRKLSSSRVWAKLLEVVVASVIQKTDVVMRFVSWLSRDVCFFLRLTIPVEFGPSPRQVEEFREAGPLGCQ